MNVIVSIMKHANWNDLRLFLTVTRSQTLRAASEKTGLSPATLSRRIDELEDALGEKLLERLQSGSTPTLAGQRIIAWAEQMEEIAVEIDRTRDLKGAHAAEGTVRINTDEWMSYFLTTRMEPFRHSYPNVDVEIITSHRPYSLTRREADVSIRPFRPSGGDLVTRKLGSLTFGLYCSKGYLTTNEQPIAEANWGELAFIGFDEPRSEFPADRWLRALPGAAMPWLRCSYALGIYDGIVHGCGLGVLANFIVRETPDLVAVIPHIPELDQDLWLSIHRALRGSARIRAVVDFIIEQMSGA